MKKYIGILKVHFENMSGSYTKILTKKYDDKETFEKWFFMYPNTEHVILENNEELDSMFKEFEDVLTPITEEEKQKIANAENEVKVLLKSKKII